jgi:predicted GTPase
VLELSEVRKIAEDLVNKIGAQQLLDDERGQEYLSQQRLSLQRALDETATPECYKVAVVGSFKVGKSSFVNALCGTNSLAPVDSNPETAAITVFKHAEEPSAEAHMICQEEWEENRHIFEADPDDERVKRYRKFREQLKDERSAPRLKELEGRLILPEGMVERIACSDWEDKGRKRQFRVWIKQFVSRRDPQHFFVKHLVVYVPAPILEGGIELIDTPGLDDTDSYRVHLTEQYIQDVDAILFLTRSGCSYSQADKDFIVRQLRRKTLKHLRLVVTKCDETYQSAIKDAQNQDEDPPTYEQHLEREESRIRVELEKTLDEVLAKGNTDEDDKAYFRAQLADIPIDFISSHLHQNGDISRSGIDGLRDRLQAMLKESERVAKARRTLLDAIERICDLTSNSMRARLETVGRDFSPQRVEQKLGQIARKVKAELAGFERKIKKEARSLKGDNDNDEELVRAKVDTMLLLCDATVNQYYEMWDVAKHWRSRRCGNWRSLYKIEQRVADTIFPGLEHLLRRYLDRFKRAVGRIRGHVGAFQKALVSIEESDGLGAGLQPLDFANRFELTFKTTVSDVGSLVDEHKDGIIRHLDSFISEEIRQRIDTARGQVEDIYGTGTTYRQSAVVQSFYRTLKSSLRESLAEYLRDQLAGFAKILLDQIDSIYTNIENDLELLTKDRLDAIQSNLSRLNENQKEHLKREIRQIIRTCDSARQRLSPEETGKAA